MTTSLATALERLAAYRTNNTRASQETFEHGCLILKSGSKTKFGDDAWAFLEQLALASIDVGRLDIADECIRQLADKFPASPRVDVLTGIRMEANVSMDIVLQYYGQLLDADPTNAAVWKRRISVLRRMGKIETAVDELSRFLDTFYTDTEGWLELADIYTSCNQYTHALQALSHALVLAPQNPFTVLQFAETAYTLGDVPLALKMFLAVVDMSEHDVSTDEPPRGICIRAWLGVKLCSRQLIAASNNTQSTSGTVIPPLKKLKLIEELATERLLAAYTGQESVAGYVSAWLAPC
ncbi:Tetratricopeptide repeat protein 35-A [Termitomyces sp. T112]|nr:Tetratricopeptide repeat protein 35-A [Termitomyces sp. T112]